MLLLAKTLDVQAGTIISASQAQDDPGSSHQVVIAAETVKYRGGEAGGLKVLADGHGVPGYFGLVQLVPYGYLTPVNTTDQHNNVNQMFWTYTVNTPELAKDGALTLDGTEGNAPLLLRADGNTAAVNVSGYPLTFNGGDVTIRSRGQTLHRINVGFFGTVTGAREGLTINNVGNWVLDANGQASASGGAAAGGIIQVKADQSSLIALDSATDPSSGNIVIRANGDDANGDGGIISVDTKSFVLGDTTRAVVSANGAPNGTGNAVTAPLESAGPFAVTFKSGSTNMIFGGGNKAVKITATGGKTSGNGGTIKVLPSTGTITVRNSLALDASAIGNNCGTSCDAGQIQVVASGEIKANTSTTAPVVPAIKANGAGSGTGGKIILQSTGDVVTEGSIEANGGCDGGDGGEITLTGENVKTLGESSASGGDGSFCLAVAGSPNSFAARLAPGSANGGKKTINANDKWLNGPLTALHFDGKGDGKGGEIIINNPNKQVDLSPLPKDGITARAGKDGKGIGGKVTIASAKGAQNSLIDVNRIIKVDGGSGVDAANDSFGKISLNGVSCEQWKTGFQNAFPATYWNCIDGARATGMPVAIAANSLPNGLRSLLGETKDQQNHPSVQIYVMASIDSWADFFKTADAGAGGVYGISSSSIRVSAAFANVYSSGALISSTAAFPPASSGSATVMQATMLHELGHQLDYIWGDITSNAQSPYNAAYLQARTDDLTRLLNSGACSNAFTVATCNANAASWAGLTNLQIYGSGNPAANPPIKGLGYSTSNLELLPIVFGHLMGAGQYGVAPDLENVVQTQFTDLSAFVQGLINNPPPAVQ